MSGPYGSKRRRPAHRRLDPAVYRRRRFTVAAVGLLLVAAVAIGLISLVGNGRGGKNTGATTTSTTTTTTTRPPTIGIGEQTVTWTDTNPSAGLAVNPAPGGSARPRTLVTQIWYPSIGGSDSSPTEGKKPDYAGGPFPVVVFAHGFDTVPTTYAPLLSAWVKAGFVVVAPLFPDENANELNSLDNRTVAQSQTAESDVVNEPYDVAYVVGQVQAGAGGAASSGAAWLKGLVEPGKIALAGHSDGAQAVAALVYSDNFSSTYAAMGVRPFGVVLLSGSELSGTYAPPSDAPPLLFVQSAVDSCNLPQDAEQLFRDAGGGWFLKLEGARHFSPYIGIGPAAPVVEKVSVTFLKATAAGKSAPSALSGVVVTAPLATLYAPGATPQLIALPEPSQAVPNPACAVPNTGG